MKLLLPTTALVLGVVLGMDFVATDAVAQQKVGTSATVNHQTVNKHHHVVDKHHTHHNDTRRGKGKND